eukprot:1453660-Prorocentrum_lima.AAC.1
MMLTYRATIRAGPLVRHPTELPLVSTPPSELDRKDMAIHPLVEPTPSSTNGENHPPTAIR